VKYVYDAACDVCRLARVRNYKFTGKERDAETGLDNFGARFDASNLGRFMTPDWAEKPTAVPYAHFGNPQSLNLYSYVENNPTTVGDPDGHVPFGWGGGGGDCPDGNTGDCQGNKQQQWTERWAATAQQATRFMLRNSRKPPQGSWLKRLGMTILCAYGCMDARAAAAALTPLLMPKNPGTAGGPRATHG